MPYTSEQYKKDKKKLIGVGLLICALIVFLLHNWNINQLNERRAERIERERQRQIDAEKEREKPTIPAFENLLDFDRFDLNQIITPEMMDKITKGIEKDVYNRKKRFENFVMTISSEWQEVQKEELERVFPGIGYEVNKINAEILFLSHNFNVTRIAIDVLKRGDINILDIGEADFLKMGLREIMFFNIIKFRETEKVNDFIRIIKELDAGSEYFRIIEKNIEEIDESEIRIIGKYSLSQKIDDSLQEIKIYSYKKIVLINGELHAFIFLSDSEIIEENREEIDKILESVIIN